LATNSGSLRLSDVHVNYGSSEILRGIDLALNPGEVVVLLGANGCGKSTALNAISGFARVRKGTITLSGRNVENLPTHTLSRFGLIQISQARDLFSQMSVEENLVLGGENRAADNKSANLEKAYTYFPKLREQRHATVATLSGGEQQMVAIARALMGEPQVLLLDEPSGGLSPRYVDEIGTILQRLKEERITMLMVEQNIALGLEVADRVVILRNGQIISGDDIVAETADPDEIVRRVYL
jgi:branched-chain amino acid transport system ATP-binding protein